MSNVIEITNLQYRYHDGTVALAGVNLRVAAGECVGLLGPNGSGKSTLLLHLNGILPEKPDGGGAVKIMGEIVGKQNLEKVRRQVGLVFQDPDDQLFCPLAAEDVAFGPQQLGLSEAEIAGRVRSALAQVGLAGFGRRATHHLSHGEKRRLCLAGVLACDPEILALDEPTSDLDPRAGANSRRCCGRFRQPNSWPRTIWNWWWKCVRVSSSWTAGPSSRTVRHGSCSTMKN